MRTVVAMAVLGALLLSAGAAFAQYGGYGAEGAKAKPEVRAKIGWFQPNKSEFDGRVAFGLDYMVPMEKRSDQTLYLTVDRLQAENSEKDTTWNVLGGINQWVKGKYYYGAGIGWARETVEQAGLADKTDSRFAWEVGVGAKLSQSGGFGEIKYRDGGQDGNRGVLFYVGLAF